MRTLVFLTALVAAGPALAASGPFLHLGNTNFVVLLAFILFVGVLLMLKVPSKLTGLLDARAQAISAELEEARALRDEAQALLAGYERQQKEVQAQADRIVEHAKMEAAEAAEQAKVDLQQSIARRMKAAEEQIAQAESNAVREVRNQAISVAVATARDIVAKGMSAKDGNSLIDNSIKQVGELLH